MTAAILEQAESIPGQTQSTAKSARCRFCGAPLQQTFVDLGMSPLCESYLKADQLNEMEPFYPLHVKVCGECFLVQLEEYVSREHIFTEYAYFSSYSDSWLRHSSNYVEMISERLGPRRRESGRRTGQQRWLLAPVFREEGDSGSGCGTGSECR